MARIEKTVFISYRRTDVYTALAVYENLKNQGYDIFFDYRSISSGDFEQIITSNIRARAHFILIITPTALDRVNEPGDWLRREIEIAIDEKRNIIPLFFKGFRFGPQAVSDALTGKLANLSRYNGLNVHEDYFDEAMQRVHTQFLNKPLDTVLHPVSTEVRKVVKEEQKAADEALKQRDVSNEPIKQAKEKPIQKKESPKPVIPIPEKKIVTSPTSVKTIPWRKGASRKIKEKQQSVPTLLKQASDLFDKLTKQSRVLSRLSRRIIFGIVSGLSVLSLLIWSNMKLLGSPVVAEVYGETITLSYWGESVQILRITLYNSLQQYQYYQQNFSLDTSQQQHQIRDLLESPEKLGEQVLNQLIDETLIRQESQKRGITVTNDEVDARIQGSFGYFPNGTPTPTITPTNISLPTLTTAQLAILYPATSTSTDTPNLTPTTVIATARLSTSTPLSVPSTATATTTTYTLSGYRDRYTKNIKNLRDAGVSESTFRSYYENQIYREKLLAVISKDVPHTQRGVLVRHILVDSEQLANDLYLQLIRGVDFVTLAKSYSKDVGSAADDGNIGWSIQGSLVPEFEQAAFSQEIGEIGKPVKSQFGYHIIQVIASEDIPASASQYEQLRQKFFIDWLTKTREDAKTAGKITTSDIWRDIVPTAFFTLTPIQP